MAIRATKDRLIVRKVETEQKVGSIILAPGTGDGKLYNEGVIVDIGHENEDEALDIDVKVGWAKGRGVPVSYQLESDLFVVEYADILFAIEE